MLDIEDYNNGVRELSLDEARRITEDIRAAAKTAVRAVDYLKELVAKAKAGKVHTQLGYRSWTAYLADVLGDAPMRLARDGRQEMSRMLTDEGMSTRAAAKVLGVGMTTVKRDVHSPGPNGPPDPDEVEADPVTGEVIEPAPTIATTENVVIAEQRHVTIGLDGKEYKRPAEVPKPKRRPIRDQAGSAGWELAKAVERIERILADDRFTSNKEEVATQLRSHLTNAIDSCQGYLDRINN